MQMICPNCGQLMQPLAADQWKCDKCDVIVEQLSIFGEVKEHEKTLFAV